MADVHNPYEKDTDKRWEFHLLREVGNFAELARERSGVYLYRPTIELTSDRKDRWGSIDYQTGVMMINRKMLRDYPWEATRQVIGHEMAHLLADRWAKGSGTIRTHGEMFKKACMTLDLEYSSGHSCEDMVRLSASAGKKDKAARLVRKLLALGDSSNQEESAAALAKAQELMLRYNIKESDKGATDRIFVVRPVGRAMKRTPAYLWTLANIVKDNYFVNTIRTYQGRNTKVFELYGTPENADVAEYVWHCLLQQGEQFWEDFKKSSRQAGTPVRYVDVYGGVRTVYTKAAFLSGVFSKYSESLRLAKKEFLEDNTALIWSGDPLLDEMYSKQYPCRRAIYPCTSITTDGYSAGAAAADRIKLRPAIRDDSAQKLLT
jgi:hypothetical protein